MQLTPTKITLKADTAVQKKLPPGVKLVQTLRGHANVIGKIAWSPDGKRLASPSRDKTVRLWDVLTGACLKILEQHQYETLTVAFSPDGKILASGGEGGELYLWDANHGVLLGELSDHISAVSCLAFDPTGQQLASGDFAGELRVRKITTTPRIQQEKSIQLNKPDATEKIYQVAFDDTGQRIAAASKQEGIQVWNTHTGKIAHAMDGHGGGATIAWNSSGTLLASSGEDRTIKLWSMGQLTKTLQGHSKHVISLDFIPNTELLVSMGLDDTVRFWNIKMGVCIAIFSELKGADFLSGLAVHPHQPRIAIVGSDPDTPINIRDRIVHIYELDWELLLGQLVDSTNHYVNAKVALIGDAGAGKTGLSLVLRNQPFRATASTHGRAIQLIDSQQVITANNTIQTREILVWDFAGQPNYRIIYQLHLHQVAVALLVFDACNETNLLAGVTYWARALHLAQQRQGSVAIPMKIFLVSARNDIGCVSISEQRLQALVKKFGFDGYFRTSAKEGRGVQELQQAITKSVNWEQLPTVSPSLRFTTIKTFLLNEQNKATLLVPERQLFKDYTQQHPEKHKREKYLQAQFTTCIGQLETHDLIRRLSFGDYILLQPELLDAFASAMLNAAKEEPDGLGSLSEEVALQGTFYIPEELTIQDHGQKQILLVATLNELLQHGLVLRETTYDGNYLVFPSQFNRDDEDAPELEGKAVEITFDGPVRNLYATLVVRLAHSGIFSTERAKMWRNTAVFTDHIGGKHGLLLQKIDEARGRLILFFPDAQMSDENRFHFETLILKHVKQRTLNNTVQLVRLYVCQNCNQPVPDVHVKQLQAKKKHSFTCACGSMVSHDVMPTPEEKTGPPNLQKWAGGEQVTLAIVFTDVIGSTQLSENIGIHKMNHVRRAHFNQNHKLTNQFRCRKTKSLGDGFISLFSSVDCALDYARALQRNAGHPQVQIRVGIHFGTMQVYQNDVFGATVGFAARMTNIIRGAEIWLSNAAKEEIDRLGATQHKPLQWQKHTTVVKGYAGTFTLWALRSVWSERSNNREEPDESQSETLGGFHHEKLNDIPFEGIDEPQSQGWESYPLDSVFVRTEYRSVAEVLERINAGQYDINPDFQRDFVWPLDKQSRLIESCLMRLPLPVFYLAEAKDGRIMIVDGLQRLTTFKRFSDNQFALSFNNKGSNNDSTKPTLDGNYFDDLNVMLQERIEETSLTLNILEREAPERAKLDIFERVNGGVPLSRQQMRNCLYHGVATRCLKTMAQNEHFTTLINHKFHARDMRDRELINRFCGFKTLGIRHYQGDMDDFLARTLEQMNTANSQELDRLHQTFETSMRHNKMLFDRHAFRKSIGNLPWSGKRTIINMALFDVFSVIFSEIDTPTIMQKQHSIREAFSRLLQDQAFLATITHATSHKNAVIKKFNLAEQTLKRAMT